LEAGIVASDIGIISPYSAQTEYLKSLFKDVSPEISSVDSFQGREKKVIFISCVRSNHEGQIGFLADTRRMNVAMTRAKQLCIIIGDSATLANHAFYEAYLNYKEDTAGLHSVWEWSE
jgi:superfamily I DNA and/or RNA helicase